MHTSHAGPKYISTIKISRIKYIEITPMRQSGLNLERGSKLQTFCEIVNHSSVYSSLLGSCGFRGPGTVLILQLMPEIYQIKEKKILEKTFYGLKVII